MTARCLLAGVLALAILLTLRDISPGTGAPPAPAPAKEPAASSYTKDVVPFLTAHCYHCHGNGKKRAGLSLDQFKDNESLQKGRKLWENVIHMIQRGRCLPGNGRDRPLRKPRAC